MSSIVIQNQIALDTTQEVWENFEEADQSEGLDRDDRGTQQYANLFFLLQSDPRLIAALCRFSVRGQD
ncbi:uncharacterized protein MELLADRAFT_89928 [Melampsora larici-populina 98AG31]|uniref:Uncharacterized protein n=1 Tax=Melampsora larici-populina (strain 98AG31 / pathotype 3-4-7) TaxID=747676 RepID=F4SEC0_MELLP|nr:uncharacterized protein MELLADRAFT_89928 [Melampsora larici-populina 98AG31]EGF97006.1 hypothetical protein MELLADRAFT_89928 [Melampsora larici-populina 98AG31]